MPHGAKPQPENQEKPPLTSAEVRGPNGVRGLQHTIAWSVGGKEQQEQLPIVPNFQIQSFIRPKHNIRPIPNLPLFSEYVSYMWFEYNGRLLTQEECHSLMRMVFYEHEYPLENNLFERAFRTPNVVAVALQDVDDALKQEWIRQVGRWFDKLRDNDTTAKYRAEALRGV